jgi:hypothetical protein
MRTRAIGALAIVAALAGTATTQVANAAKVKPVCNLITDPKGDSNLDGVPGEGTVDIVSADIASNAKTLTAVVRLADLQNPDPESPLGLAYYLEFNVPGSSAVWFLTARLYPTGNHFFFGYQGPDPLLPLNTLYATDAVTGVVDTAKKEIRVSAPLSVVNKSVKVHSGVKLSGLVASAYKVLGQGLVPSQNVGPGRLPLGGLSETYDTAPSSKIYVMGTPSCVAVGK